ncbi:hypothetical protein F5Y06DRAFT_138452 [Hypoxylon sp. FL0890]|nr:hypothetical protein F5Y06DRAFT_138452 [Hypoxylon sp. FL0890]
MATHHKPLVYRLRRIPSYIDNEVAAAQLLSRAVHLPSSEIKICSLATVATSSWSMPTRVATLMFDSIPQVLHNGNQKRQWEFNISGCPESLILDSHFYGMTPLYDILPPHEHQFNCIAISGLASHPFGSWQPKGGSKTFMWLRDALPRQYPTVRAWIYGYDTSLDDKTSFQSIPDLAASLIDHLKANDFASPSAPPIILIAHSLGGIVLKQAITRLALCGERELHALDLIKGAILFGVPNLGMEQSHLRALVDQQPNQVLINDLAIGSPYLYHLNGQFLGHLLNQKMKVFWGYETRKSLTAVRGEDGNIQRSGTHEILVSKESATSNQCNEYDSTTFPINEDHSNMVKFVEDDPICRVVLDKVGEIMSYEAPSRSIHRRTSWATTSSGSDSPSQGESHPGPSVSGYTPLRLNLPAPIDLKPRKKNMVNFAPVNMLVSSLDVPELHRRFEDIEKRSRYTFEWIYENDDLEFSSWLRSGKGVYWISGKPGSGKSTLMKFIFDDPRTRDLLKHWRDENDPIIAGFFFHHRGSVLQKSLEGLIRSIVAQILRQRPALANFLTPLVEASLGKKFPLELEELKEMFKRHAWTQQSLGNALRLILRQKLVDLDMCFFFDALDEYDGSPEVIRDFLTELLDESKTGQTTVKICFSSRPWEAFTQRFQGGLGFPIHEYTTTDIKEYCYQTISQDSTVANVLKDMVPDIIETAQGVFLWARLALSDLFDAAASGREMYELKRRLRELPPDLHRYYEDIVKRCPTALKEKAYALLEIVTRSFEILPVYQVLLILACSYQPTYKTCRRAVKSGDIVGFNLYAARKLVNSACGGLLEITENNREFRIQLMHQTVREFVLSPKFKTLILGNLAKYQHENGHSFFVKLMFVFRTAPPDTIFKESRYHESMPRYSDADIARHCKSAELTTGKSQLDFLKTVPTTCLALDNLEEIPRISLHDFIFDFAMYGGLHLCIKDLLNEPYRRTEESLNRLFSNFIRLVTNDGLEPPNLRISLDLLRDAGFQFQGRSQFFLDVNKGLFASKYSVFSDAPLTIVEMKENLFELISYLLEKEHNPIKAFRSLVDDDGNTLYICNRMLVTWLLEHGMDPSSPDSHGRSPVDYAVISAANFTSNRAIWRELAGSTLLILQQGGLPRKASKRLWSKARRRFTIIDEEEGIMPSIDEAVKEMIPYLDAAYKVQWLKSSNSRKIRHRITMRLRSLFSSRPS